MLRYQIHLEQKNLALSTISVRLPTIRDWRMKQRIIEFSVVNSQPDIEFRP